MSAVYPESPLGSPVSETGLAKVLAEAARYKAERDEAREEANDWALKAAQACNERDAAREERDAEAIRFSDLLIIANRDRDDAVTLLDGCQRELGLAVDRKREAEAGRDTCRERNAAIAAQLDQYRDERDRYGAALERVRRILRGEGVEVADDEELAAIIASTLAGDGT